MSVLYSILFLVTGIILQLVFSLLERLVIFLYSFTGEKLSSRFYQIPFEVLYWSKFPVVSIMLYYMVTYIPYEFELLQMIFYFSLFAIGMYIMSQYFDDLDY